MSHWRSRVGETGVAEMLKESIASAVRNKVAKKRDFEKVNGYVKSDRGLDRNMPAGSLGDRINAVLAGVGFNLVKLMKGLARLFLCLRTEADGFAEFLSELLRFLVGDMNRLRQPLCPDGDSQKQVFV